MEDPTDYYLAIGTIIFISSCFTFIAGRILCTTCISNSDFDEIYVEAENDPV